MSPQACSIASARQRNSSRCFVRRTSWTHFVKASASAHSGASGDRFHSSSIQPVKHGDANGGGAGNRRETRHSTQHEPYVLWVQRAVVRRHGLTFAQPLLGGPRGLETRVRRLWATIPRLARCAVAASRSAPSESIQARSTARASGWSPRSIASRMGRRSLWCGARLASRNPSSGRRSTLALSCWRTSLVAPRCFRARVTTLQLNFSLSNRKISSADRDSWSGVVSGMAPAVTIASLLPRQDAAVSLPSQYSGRLACNGGLRWDAV